MAYVADPITYRVTVTDRQTAVGFLPKLVCDVDKCEIARVLKLWCVSMALCKARHRD